MTTKIAFANVEVRIRKDIESHDFLGALVYSMKSFAGKKDAFLQILSGKWGIPVWSLIFLFLTAFLFAVTGSSITDDYRVKRLNMVERDIRGRGISDRKVLDAMSKIERHLFVDTTFMDSAYNDHPLPIAEGQTISQPYVVALMTEALKLKPADKVLEIGTGSGYQAAVLAEIVSGVYTIEIRKKLAEKSTDLLHKLGYKNIKVKPADGYYGWDDYAPFDAIIVTASANHIPSPLIRQLKEGGRLIIPLGSTVYFQMLTLATKTKGELEIRQMGSVAFVPMTGQAMKGKH